ncbi:ferritin-like domain-containing protein [Azoarcus sp. DN11]|uniref:ferritin-like domain-containing protein n=1 Tax=Azoarcus sp. DN11 TaxID=356837 RepID=UPI0013E3EB45|nr:ferritin-like domain-containing protein [Azoarcus sp. DN11]
MITDVKAGRAGARAPTPSSAAGLAGVAVPELHESHESRRLFLQQAVTCSTVLPVLVGLTGPAWGANANPPATTGPRVVRSFNDAYLELVRLLREACEVEHVLMLQYLYAGFSLTPAYRTLAGSGTPGADTLLGVAVQEMQHLASVNHLLVLLGAAPNLLSAEFPYEPQIYPFEFNLEPLSPRSLSKYIYAEAPIGFFDGPRSPADAQFADSVLAMIGPKRRPNHVGSLYNALIALVGEVSRRPGMPKLDAWLAKLEAIKAEGEKEHFIFFKNVFLAHHPAFDGHRDAWQLAPTDPAYPAYAVPVNPTAYVGHENEILNPDLRALAWLADLHYWTALLLLDLHFRSGDDMPRSLALAHMSGPLLSLGRHLPILGGGLPFDPLNFGSAPALDMVGSRRLIASLVRESMELAKAMAPALPADYPAGVAETTLVALSDNRQIAARAP